MRILKFTTVFIFLLSIVFFSGGCKKDKLATDPSAKLEFSTDTLTFDTVFTTLGSTTLNFRVFNRNKNTVRISSIMLGGGEASNFRINVDGILGPVQEDVEIPGKDSIWVFVEVTVDPNNQNLPMVIYDSVQFITNGNRQRVILEAWGQDAHFYRNQAICDEVWTNDKPHVILNYAVVDSGCTLTIESGTQVFMGGGAGLLVYGTATLNVNGTLEDPVVFQGIRLESFYDDLPGQWAAIFILRGSINNTINYAIIENSDQGINVGGVPNRLDSSQDVIDNFTVSNIPEVEVTNTIIQNSLGNAIFGLLSDISAENCLFFNSGDALISLGFGGLYDFKHCTMANFGSATIDHKAASLFLGNVLVLNQQAIIPAELIANFENTIVYGSLDEELEFAEDSSAPFNSTFNYCLVKTEMDTTASNFSNTIFNKDPLFTDRTEDDYTLSENSPCIDAGKLTSVQTDLAGQLRSDGKPDLGAYEYSE